MLLPCDILEISSILHVGLLVFLRLMKVLNPLSDGVHTSKTFRRITVIVIWTLSVMLEMIPLITSILTTRNNQDDMKKTSTIIRLVILHCFNTLPVVGIIIMWGSLVWKARSNRNSNKFQRHNIGSRNSGSIEQRMGAIVRRLVILLLICYLPYLAWKQYFYGVVIKRCTNKLTYKVNILLYYFYTYDKNLKGCSKLKQCFNLLRLKFFDIYFD